MAQTESIPTAAARKGFTLEVFLAGPMADLEGFVKPGTDYDDRFPFICGDTGDLLMVNGWLIESVEEHTPSREVMSAFEGVA